MPTGPTCTLTPAQAQLAERQRKHPPSYPRNSLGNDRALALARVLVLPEALETRFRAGSLVYGEVGDMIPDAHTLPLRDDNFVVLLTSGMMDFLYAVGRAMAGATVLWSEQGERQNAQALDTAHITELVAGTFKQWHKFCQPSLWDLFWRSKRIEHPDFAIGERVRSLTEAMVTSAELYMLAHETGHVLLDLGLTSAPQANEEMRADAVGFGLYLPVAQAAVRPRMAYAGAGFALRVLSALSHAGVRFSRAYPPAPERLAGLLAVMRQSCPSDGYFDEVSTVMVANFGLMDAVDALIVPGSMPNPLATWQARVSMIAVLQAVAERERPPSEFAEMFKLTAEEEPAADLADVAAVLCRYYQAGDGAGYVSDAVGAAMSASLADCIQSLPQAHRRLFTPGASRDSAASSSRPN